MMATLSLTMVALWGRWEGKGRTSRSRQTATLSSCAGHKDWGSSRPLPAHEQANITGTGAHREWSSPLRPEERHNCSKPSAERSSDVLAAETNPLGKRDYSQTLW